MGSRKRTRVAAGLVFGVAATEVLVSVAFCWAKLGVTNWLTRVIPAARVERRKVVVFIVFPR